MGLPVWEGIFWMEAAWGVGEGGEAKQAVEGAGRCPFSLRNRAPATPRPQPRPAHCSLPLCPLSPPKAAVGGQVKGAGLCSQEAEYNSPAALECQASRSPAAAARLLAPARSQEQPGARSPGSGNASRPVPPRPSSACRLPETRTDFLCLADPGSRSRPSYWTPIFCLVPATGPLQTLKGCSLP